VAAAHGHGPPSCAAVVLPEIRHRGTRDQGLRLGDLPRSNIERRQSLKRGGRAQQATAGLPSIDLERGAGSQPHACARILGHVSAGYAVVRSRAECAMVMACRGPRAQGRERHFELFLLVVLVKRQGGM